MIPQRFFDQVAEELARKELHAGMWARSLSEASGDEKKAKSLYIKNRAVQLEDGTNYEQRKKARIAKEAEKIAKKEKKERRQAELDKFQPSVGFQIITWIVLVSFSIFVAYLYVRFQEGSLFK